MDELGADTVELMRTIKRAIDPHDIMNPGKASTTWGILCRGRALTERRAIAVPRPRTGAS